MHKSSGLGDQFGLGGMLAVLGLDFVHHSASVRVFLFITYAMLFGCDCIVISCVQFPMLKMILCDRQRGSASLSVSRAFYRENEQYIERVQACLHFIAHQTCIPVCVSLDSCRCDCNFRADID